MTPHGPDTAAFQEATHAADNVPKKLPEDTLAFMFEVCIIYGICTSSYAFKMGRAREIEIIIMDMYQGSEVMYQIIRHV
jgi:homogentisate 1,2-dioxygenase